MSRNDLKLMKKVVPKGGKTKSGAKGIGDDRKPPRNVGTASVTLPAMAAEEEAGAFSRENDRRDRPSTKPFSGSSSGYPGMFQPERAQLQGYEMSHLSTSDIENFFDFTSNWDLTRPAPLRSTSNLISNVAEDAGLSTSGLPSGYAFEDTLAFPNMQTQPRRGQVAKLLG
jgi:hypothetical protein